MIECGGGWVVVELMSGGGTIWVVVVLEGEVVG